MSQATLSDILGRAADALAEASELLDGCPDDDVAEKASSEASEAGAALASTSLLILELVEATGAEYEADKAYSTAKTGDPRNRAWHALEQARARRQAAYDRIKP